ncbi:NAD(P)H-binding protein [Chitinophaga agrisoli]|uniref:NAD(P)H-binding protein n=1 Tax=Chitinophaga agrisoli TaxID=2607653 RepID=A0A5B2VLB4_9BACT|nr:NAD(P)H-binding protein [Chitinophaga agrisoli]KAA2239430.1 NAD(P)H-binding protein [Chitinophaga agrisoli]
MSNITITGSLGNIGQRLTRSLVAKGHRVTVISSQPERAAAIEALQAIPAIGTVTDRDFLQRAFKDADAVYTMIPPDFTATDIRAYIKGVGEGYAAAIAQTGVKHVVNLSAIGSHRADGPGPTGANHHVEQQLNALPDTHVLHLRPGMFYTNFLGSIPLIRYQQLIGSNYDATANIVLSHPEDIAAAAFEALDTRAFIGKQVQYIAGDEQNGGAIARILGEAVGLPNLTWTAFPDEAMLQALLQTGMSEQMARVYIIEIGIAIRNGDLIDDYRLHQGQASGKITLADFAREFAAVYTASAS